MEATEHRFPLTVMILTRDEEINIDACLRSVAWANDVVIVDSGSTDGTLELARSSRPDVRIFSRPFTDFGDQRNWAIDNAAPRHEWILFLDADERCDDECAVAIRLVIEQPEGRSGFYLASRNFFLGKWISRCTMYPCWQLRLLRHGEVRFRKEGHGQREVTQAPVGFIRAPYDHFPFSKGVAEWIGRHNRYSTEEAALVLKLKSEPLSVGECFSRDALKRRRALKRLASRTGLLRPIARFVYSYVLRGGFLDGRAGLLYCFLIASHNTHIVVKMAEMSAVCSNKHAS